MSFVYNHVIIVTIRYLIIIIINETIQISQPTIPVKEDRAQSIIPVKSNRAKSSPSQILDGPDLAGLIEAGAAQSAVLKFNNTHDLVEGIGR